MEDRSVGMLVSAFILLLIGVVLVGQVASIEQEKVNLALVSQELVDITNARDPIATGVNGVNATPFTLAKANTGWKVNDDDCDITISRLSNATTGSVIAAVTTDYAISTDGVLTLVNSTWWNENPLNTTYIDYTRCNDDYVAEGWQRTVMNLVPGFFGLALLIVAAGLALSVLSKEGII